MNTVVCKGRRPLGVSHQEPNSTNPTTDLKVIYLGDENKRLSTLRFEKSCHLETEDCNNTVYTFLHLFLNSSSLYVTSIVRQIVSGQTITSYNGNRRLKSRIATNLMHAKTVVTGPNYSVTGKHLNDFML